MKENEKMCNAQGMKWEGMKYLIIENILGRPGRRWEVIVEICGS
jgi:hypothetical protein